MKRIILHWSGGGYSPNGCDLEHYHFLVDKFGKIFKGKFSPQDNKNCNDGKYAKHTGGLNTGSIGVALCAMFGYKNPKNIGKFPFLRVQAESAFAYCATLLKKYDLKPSKQSVLTHYEVGLMYPNSESAGKQDINFIPYEPEIRPDFVGDYIREKIRWYYGKQ